MNKSKIVVFALLALSIAQLDAGIKTNNGPSTGASKRKTKTIPIKHETGDQEDTGIMDVQKPEEHTVMPFGKHVLFYNKMLSRTVKFALQDTIEGLLNQFPNNLKKTCSTPTQTRGKEGVRLVTYVNPEWNQKSGIAADAHSYCYIYETPVQPRIIVKGATTDYEQAIDDAFHALVEKYARHGLAITCAGGIQEPKNWIVKYQNPNYKNMPGSGKECIVYFKAKQVTPEDIQDLKAKSSQG